MESKKGTRLPAYPFNRGGKGSRTPDLPASCGTLWPPEAGWKIKKGTRLPAYPFNRGGKGSRTPDLPASCGTLWTTETGGK